MAYAPRISIIVPCAKHDTPHPSIMRLAGRPAICDIQVIRDARSRADALNRGARSAQGDIFWFVHADTQISKHAYDRIVHCVSVQTHDTLWYCRLHFFDGPFLLKINAWGANIRSSFGFPYGDQAFCCARTVFTKLGGFPMHDIGEDLAFVLAAHRADVPIKSVDATISTSGRTYRNHGWCKTTWTYNKYFMQQLYAFYRRRPNHS